jgi:hypothetical protein
LTWYCSECWAQWGEGLSGCLICGGTPGQPEVFVSRLTQALDRGNDAVLQRAVQILGHLRRREVVPQLIGLLQTSDNEFVLEGTARALGAIGDRQAVAALSGTVRSGPRAAREAAAVALATLGATEALTDLRQVEKVLGALGLHAIGYLEGHQPQPPAFTQEPPRRAVLEGDPTVLLREYANRPTCPICALMLEDISGFLAQWPHLAALFAVVRERLRQSDGFCGEHLRALGEVTSPQGLGTVLSEWVAHVAQSPAGASNDTPCGEVCDSRSVPPSAAVCCPLCRLCMIAERQYLEAINDLVNDASFREAYLAGRGVCMPHFRCLREEMPPGALRRWLDETQSAHFERLVIEMRSYTRKHEQRLRQEMTHDERYAAIRALRKLRGDPTVKSGISASHEPRR